MCVCVCARACMCVWWISLNRQSKSRGWCYNVQQNAQSNKLSAVVRRKTDYWPHSHKTIPCTTTYTSYLNVISQHCVATTYKQNPLLSENGTNHFKHIINRQWYEGIVHPSVKMTKLYKYRNTYAKMIAENIKLPDFGGFKHTSSSKSWNSYEHNKQYSKLCNTQ